MARPIDELIKITQDWFKDHKNVAVALSGGVDSSLAIFLASKFLGKEKTVAVISASASLKKRDLDEVRDFCREFDIRLEEIDAREIDDQNYSSNPVDRCFYCKSALYSSMDKLISERYQGYSVINGNNWSDMGDWRPGIKAASDFRVYSPLADCRITKDEIRALATHFGLPNSDKPASPCLSSRFPYGETITEVKLRMVEVAEEIIDSYGFSNVRVRYINGNARIEVPANETVHLKNKLKDISPKIQTIGFSGVEIDTEGLVSGKLNRGIEKAS